MGGVGDFDIDAGKAFQDFFNLVGPLDYHDRAGVEEIVEAEHFKIALLFDAAGVYMIDLQPAYLFIDENKGRAADTVGAVGADGELSVTCFQNFRGNLFRHPLITERLHRE